jgi:hypothetical protein
MRVRRSPVATAAAALCFALVLPATAFAHGDPGSDTLYSADLFAGSGAGLPAGKRQQLTTIVGEASKRGYRIKVAVIATRADLGAATAFWRRPQAYAAFLGDDLYYVYKGPVLAVMPNGYGVFRSGKGLAGERAVLARLAAPNGDVAGAAARAVRRLAATAGVQVVIPPMHADSGNRDRLLIVLIVAAVVLIAGLVFVPRRRRRGSEA